MRRPLPLETLTCGIDSMLNCCTTSIFQLAISISRTATSGSLIVICSRLGANCLHDRTNPRKNRQSFRHVDFWMRLGQVLETFLLIVFDVRHEPAILPIPRNADRLHLRSRCSSGLRIEPILVRVYDMVGFILYRKRRAL